MDATDLKKIQQTKLLSLMNNEELSDVTFEIGNESFGTKEFHGMRGLFAGQSDVLKSMLYGNMIESSIDNKVIISDIHPCGFEWFQSYCYGIHNVKITHENIAYILHICDKYCMKQCYNACLKQLGVNCLSNSDHLLHILHVLSQLSLVHIIHNILQSDEFGQLKEKQCHELLLNEKFFSLPPIVVHDILFDSKQDFIKVCNQYNLWYLLKHYCQLQTEKEKARQRNVLCKDDDADADELDEVKVASSLDTSDNCDCDCEDNTVEPPLKKSGMADNEIGDEKGENATTSDKSECGSNDNCNNYHWTVVMKKHFLNYFDFSSMSISFFMKNIYHCTPSLLTNDEKITVCESFADRSVLTVSDDKIKINTDDQFDIGMTLKDTLFTDEMQSIQIDKHQHNKGNIVYTQNNTIFGTCQTYRVDVKTDERECIFTTKNGIDLNTAANQRYHIFNLSWMGIDDKKCTWQPRGNVMVGFATREINIQQSFSIGTISHLYHVYGSVFPSVQSYIDNRLQVRIGSVVGKKAWEPTYVGIDASNLGIIRCIFDTRKRMIYFYNSIKRADAQLLHSISIPDGEVVNTVYPLVYVRSHVGDSCRDPSMLVESSNAHPFWPVKLPV